MQGFDEEIDKITRTKRRPPGRRFAFSLVISFAGYLTLTAASKLTPLVPDRQLASRFGDGTKAGSVR